MGHSWVMAAGSAFFLPFPSSSAAAPMHRQLYSGLQQPAARGPTQAVPGHVPSPQNLFLGTAIIVGFTYFLLSVVSLTLRGFVSPKGSSCSLFPLESKGWIIRPSLCAAAFKCVLTSPVLKFTWAPGSWFCFQAKLLSQCHSFAVDAQTLDLHCVRGIWVQRKGRCCKMLLHNILFMRLPVIRNPMLDKIQQGQGKTHSSPWALPCWAGSSQK